MLDKLKRYFFEITSISHGSQKSSLMSVIPARSLEERIEQRVQLGVQQAIAYASNRANELAAADEKLLQHLPGFLNAAATVPALSHKLLAQQKDFEVLQGRLTELLARTDVLAAEQVAGSAQWKLCSESISAAENRMAELIAKFCQGIDNRIEKVDDDMREFSTRADEVARSVPELRNLLDKADRDIVRVQHIAEQASGEVRNLEAEVARGVPELHNLLDKADRDIVRVQHIAEQGFGEIRNLQAEVARVGTLAVVAEQAGIVASSLVGTVDRTSGEIGNLWKSAELATSEIGKLWQRLEFVRNEVLYEIKYSADAKPLEAQGGQAKARFLNQEAFAAAASDGIKINIGSGHVPVAGYLNVDARELPGVDVVADVSDMPFEAKSLSEIFSSHVLEHFPEEKLRRLLPYWKDLLRQDGIFRAIVPDGEAMLNAVTAGEYSFGDFRQVLFGGQEYEGDFHFNMFTPDSLKELLQDAGFTKVTLVEKGRRNGNCFEFEISATA